MSEIKWFDLKAHGGKLERLRNSNDTYHLRLTVGESLGDADLARAVASGWMVVPDTEDKVFDNYRRLDRLSEILDTLTPFYEVEVIRGSLSTVSKLRQGEQVQGFVPALDQDSDKAVFPPQDAIAANLQLLDSSKRDQILARVSAAQKVAGMAGTTSSKLFHNDGLNIWRELVQHFGYQEATHAMVGVIALSTVDGEMFEAAHEDLIDAAEKGRGLPKITTGKAGEMAENVVSMLKDRAKYQVAASIRTEREAYLGFVRMVRAHYQVWDGARTNYRGAWREPDTFGNKFLADPGMPEAWKVDVQHRTSAALAGVAALLNVDPRNLFGGSSRIFHLGKSAGSVALGYRQQRSYRVDGEIVQTAAVKTTPFTAGVLLHEIGHEIDLSNADPKLLGMSDAERAHLLLDATGVREEVNRLIYAEQMSDDRRAYLSSDAEIIARTFECAISDKLTEKADAGMEAVGGIYTTHGGSYFSPSKEAAAKFLIAFADILKLAKERRLDREIEAQAAARSIEL